jgi:hypothetical protein
MEDTTASDLDVPLAPLTRAEVVDRLAADTGRSRETAGAMVRDYLDETSDRLGYSVHRWGMDTGDVDEIRRDYEWIDYERGETAPSARARAAEYARGWSDRAATVDRDHSPGYASRADREAALWADRAKDFEPSDLTRVQAAPATDSAAALPFAEVDEQADEHGWSS